MNARKAAWGLRYSCYPAWARFTFLRKRELSWGIGFENRHHTPARWTHGIHRWVHWLKRQKANKA